MSRAIRDALFAHVDRCFPVHDKDFASLDGHPLASRLPHLRVVHIAPSYRSEPHVYLSVGAWILGQEAGGGTELFLLADEAAPSHAHAVGDALLQLGEHPVQNGQFVRLAGGWTPGSACDQGLVTLPYPYGPALEQVQDSPLPIRILWLCPVTSAERAFGERLGLEALEQRLEGIHFQDPRRPSRV